MDLFRKCMEPVEKTLRDAKMDKSNVHEVGMAILAGMGCVWPEGTLPGNSGSWRLVWARCQNFEQASTRLLAGCPQWCCAQPGVQRIAGA